MSTAVAVRPATRKAPTSNAFAHTGALIRFMLRRDRIRIPAWLVVLAGGSVAVARAYVGLYPHPADRTSIAHTMGTPAGLAMTGPKAYLREYNIGSMTAHEMLGFVGVLVGIMTVLMFVRHTRAEEETGRAELVRAGVVGRHAQLAAAVVVVAGANIALGVLTAVGMASFGGDEVPWGSSILYGAAHTALGIVFVGVSAVAVQVSQHSRGASGIAFAVIGLAYVLRAVGDVLDDWVVWLSPIGWSQQTLAYVDDRWWPLAVSLVVGVVLVGAGAVLSTRRDVGSGLRAERPGASTASAFLTTPIGFALRLHRGLLVSFTVGMALLGVAYGSVLEQINGLLNAFPATIRHNIAAGGHSLTDSFTAMIIVVLAIVASVYVVLAVTKLRGEETSGRAEPVLATAIHRQAWIGSHIAVAFLGGAFVLVAAVLGFGVAGAVSTGDADVIGRLLGAGLAYVPAVWLVGGVAVLFYGWEPKAVPAVWIVVEYAFVVGYLGKLLQFPDWLNDLSPFGHVPNLPAAGFRLAPVLWLLAVAVVLTVAGMIGFRRRNVTGS